ncbi:glutathione S-transferase family protein [Maricurvus nonylphenolicus]|uniref:glutathione S-transferase family protein n=1 Tax=Maricurvus nonylphenolicus TaxID=1008307 RepID=UPI0036F33BCD
MTASSSINDPIQLIGATGSPYTQKMVALLRYRHIPYRIMWGDPATTLDAMGIEKPKIAFMPTVLLPNDEGKLVAVCDSTPIIHRLEGEKSDRSVVPADPVLAFLNFVLEDFADEWFTKCMFHYRWYYEQDALNAGRILSAGIDITQSDETLQQFNDFFSQRQIERLKFVGSNDTTAPIIDASYRRIVTLLDKHYQTSPYLLGSRPGSSDFALFGQLTQLVGVDPTPRAITHDLSSRTVAWVLSMYDLCGLEPEESGWLQKEALPESLKAIFEEVGRTYVPALLANAKAIAAGDKEWQTEIDGCVWTQQSFPYQGKCLKWIREEFQALSAEDQKIVENFLAGTGCEPLLLGNQ